MMQIGDEANSNSNGESNLKVSVSLNEINVQFSGSIETVLSSVMTFISKQIPAIELARKISLNYALPELIDDFGNFIKITPEGPIIDLAVGGVRLSDKQIVALYLVAMKIASELGKGVENKVPISQIQVATNVNPKSVSSRLSELVKSGHVVKESNKNISQGGVYYINTAGIHWLISSLSKKKI